jgi:hypothetical protein
MKLSGFRWVRSMNSVLGVCLCLVLIGLVTAGAVVYTNRSCTGGILPGVQVCQAEPLQRNNVDYTPPAISGNEPVIQVFKADPMELSTADSAAVYTFKVKRAKNVQIDEAGTSIKNISNPSGATLQGTATGLPASAIHTDDSGKFITRLMASNDYGSVKAELTLSLAQELLPPGQPTGPTENQPEPRSPKWLDPYSTPRTSTPSTTTHNEPRFFTCPQSCASCLESGEAVKLGYTQRCSDQRCYYSPDNQRSWYCYSEPEGWCCGNGNVYQSTKGECNKIGGYWSTNQNEAIQACEPEGYCCLNDQVYYPATRDQCVQMGGSYWSTNQAQTLEHCQPTRCWCCAYGKVFQATKDQCAQSGGACYTTQSQATRACRDQGETIYQTPSYLK